MNQLSMTFDAPSTHTRARRTDPATSHKAAERAKLFAPSHADRIYSALRDSPLVGMNAEEIGKAAGLTVVQVDRRTVELQRKGLIYVRQVNGQDMVHHGMRVWSVAA